MKFILVYMKECCCNAEENESKGKWLKAKKKKHRLEATKSIERRLHENKEVRSTNTLLLLDLSALYVCVSLRRFFISLSLFFFHAAFHKKQNKWFSCSLLWMSYEFSFAIFGFSSFSSSFLYSLFFLLIFFVEAFYTSWLIFRIIVS